jgi:hypothetical protein
MLGQPRVFYMVHLRSGRSQDPVSSLCKMFALAPVDPLRTLSQCRRLSALCPSSAIHWTNAPRTGRGAYHQANPRICRRRWIAIDQSGTRNPVMLGKDCRRDFFRRTYATCRAIPQKRVSAMIAIGRAGHVDIRDGSARSSAAPATDVDPGVCGSPETLYQRLTANSALNQAPLTRNGEVTYLYDATIFPAVYRSTV